MKEMIAKIKFVHILLTLVLLSMVGFYAFPKESEVAITVVTAVVGAFGTLVGFIAGKSRPDEEEK